MNKPRRLAVVLLIAGISFVLSGLSMAVVLGQDNAAGGAAPANASAQGNVVAGTIMNEKGAVSGAIVQAQGTSNKTQTAEDGSFTLSGLGDLSSVTLTAWSAGHYIGWIKLD